jgi:hypothetical protein
LLIHEAAQDATRNGDKAIIRALGIAGAVVLATALVPQGSTQAEAAKKGKSISGKAGKKAGTWHELTLQGDVAAARKSGRKKKGKKGN